MKKIEKGVTSKYYYSGSVVLYTADADNNKISGNIPTPSGEIIATKDYANATNADGSANTFANKYYFYHYDIRGSVTTLLKPDATFEQGYSYDEYGNTTVENSASLFHNEMSYTGAISDLTTGLSYMNARYYNPATGTFTSQDTYYGSAYSPWTQHLYSYAMGNPINFIDPTGHKADWGTIFAGALLVTMGIAAICTGVGAIAGGSIRSNKRKWIGIKDFCNNLKGISYYSHYIELEYMRNTVMLYRYDRNAF